MWCDFKYLASQIFLFLLLHKPESLWKFGYQIKAFACDTFDY